MQEVNVSWEMPVAFTNDLFGIDNLLLRDTVIGKERTKCHRLLVFIDAGVIEADSTLLTRLSSYCEHHSEHLKLACPPISLPAGEELKNNWQQIESMLTVCHDLHIDRHSYVVGIGGGALLDSVGLVAAIAHRGIRHIRIPTTVLAQNDSGVGVKNGINLFGQKNYLGTFAPPSAVLNDYKFIESLTERDKICGMSEAVKVALIRDRIFFSWLEKYASSLQNFDATAMQHMIKRCAELHMHQICHGGDPFETGSARPLDFGHWSAHKLETLSDHSLRHGEAVAIGIGYAAVVAQTLGRIDQQRVDEHKKVLASYDLPTKSPSVQPFEELLVVMERDKKALTGVTFILDGPVGPEVVPNVDVDALRSSYAAWST